MKKLIRFTAIASMAMSYGLFARASYACGLWHCEKQETPNQLQQPAHANTCATAVCDTCKYYFTPDYECAFGWGNCDIKTKNDIATTVFVVGCLAGAQNCQCPGTGGVPQTATISLSGETCN